jgi:hypothetical protein
MKRITIFFKFLIIAALFLNLLFGLAAHASGHKIPTKTDLSFCFSAFILITLLIILFYLGKQKHHRKE